MPDPLVPITRPLLGEREADAVRRVILSGWVTQGPETAAFEREFAGRVGASHAVAVSSCTAALHLALLALDVTSDDEVIVPTLSFIATANAVRYVGAVPVFVDIDPLTYNIDPRRVKAALTPRTRAIVCVHQMGMPCALADILELARQHDIPVIEDAACAAGSELKMGSQWEPIGRPHGTVACFSFHPRKLVTAGEGGMLTTSDAALAARVRRLRHHGMSISDRARHSSETVVVEEYAEIGHNYRMTDIQAAVAREQLKRLSEIVSLRRGLADRYRELLRHVDVVLPVEPSWAHSNWQSYCVRLPRESEPRRVMQRMLDRQIATRPGILCAHQEPAYRDEPSVIGPGGLHESERARAECILLPLFPQLTHTEQERVVQALAESL